MRVTDSLFFRSSLPTHSHLLGSASLLALHPCSYEYPTYKYTSFFQMVPFEAWRDAWNRASDQCEPEELLKATYNSELRPCPKCSKEEDVQVEVKHVQDGSRAPPQCIAMLVKWQSGAAASDDISLLLSLLPLAIDLSLINDNVIPGTNYRLRCMICLYGNLFPPLRNGVHSRVPHFSSSPDLGF